MKVRQAFFLLFQGVYMYYKNPKPVLRFISYCVMTPVSPFKAWDGMNVELYYYRFSIIMSFVVFRHKVLIYQYSVPIYRYNCFYKTIVLRNSIYHERWKP